MKWLTPPLFLLLPCFLLTPWLGALAEPDPFVSLQKKYEKKFSQETTVSVRRIRDGRELLSLNGERLMIPASTLKLFTTYAALKVLGGEYTFLTEFFLSNGASPVLSVRGHGDPTMTEERLYKIADDLARAGVKELGGIVLDDTLFEKSTPRSGLNPYEAAQSALPVNFNTINVRGQLRNGKIVTSLTSFAPHEMESSLALGGGDSSILLSEGEGGRIQVRGTLSSSGGVVEDNIAVADPTQLFGELFSGILTTRGIQLKGAPRRGAVSPALEPFLVAKSKDLSQILIDLNRYSSNFIAGQVLFALGKGNDGRYGSDRGLERLRAVLREAGIVDGVFVDGSGLKRENRVSASHLTKIISVAARDPAIAPDFLATLPRFGRRGTLKRRSLSAEWDAQVWGKTGYLNGVESVAGTFPLADGELGAYALITNGPGSKGEINAREDEFLRDLLRAAYSNSGER